MADDVEVQGKVWVYDIECLYDFFCVTFRDRDSDEKKYFEISMFKNDLKSLIEFLDSGEVIGLVGFNNLAYDWPVINYLRLVRKKLSALKGIDCARELSTFSNKIIAQKFSEVREPRIPQLDLFKIHHFDNKNKAMSLKALEIALNWPLVADMPIHHTDYVDTIEKAQAVAEYNDNDVLCTKLFLEKSKKDIELRRSLSEIFSIDLWNANEAKIGEEIILHKISRITKTPVEYLRKQNTKRDSVDLKQVMLPISFVSREFQKAYNIFSRTVLDTSIKEEGYKKTKEDKKKEEICSVIYDGVVYDFGLGGLHGLRAPGVYESTDTHVIMSVDVASYYAHLAIVNGFRPEHLDESFGIAYPEIYTERKKYKKGTPENSGLKIALVSVFGKSKSQWSPLYDPRFTMQITVNGQLLLAKLAEDITTRSNAYVLMANTDGLEIMVPRTQVKWIEDICKMWEKKTNLTLETKRYKKIFTRDINNYIGLLEDGSTYNKGAYEWDNLTYAKDHSMLCVPYAAQKFLVDGQSIQKSFDECSIDKFYIGKRAKSGGFFQIRKVFNEEIFGGHGGGEIATTDYSRTIRYLIGKDGGYLFKKEENAKNPSRIDSPWKVIDCMDMRNADLEALRAKIDYRFYEQEVKKILSPILDRQMTLL